MVPNSFCARGPGVVRLYVSFYGSCLIFVVHTYTYTNTYISPSYTHTYITLFYSCTFVYWQRPSSFFVLYLYPSDMLPKMYHLILDSMHHASSPCQFVFIPRLSILCHTLLMSSTHISTHFPLLSDGAKERE
ncbi:MAG: hypothetical protein J3R72DRAFT_447978 [Linnemannia gamsii]|nr:MAG: hypothetical protein J3R72DRAFT_447978 [Linnemannia gamsii]